MKRRSSLLAIAVLAASLAAGAGANASDTQTSVSAPAVSVPMRLNPLHRPDCTLTIGGYGLNGSRRTNGTWYGTLYWHSAINCDGNVVYLWTKAELTKLPSTKYTEGSPGSCGVDRISATPTPACKSVAMTGGTHYCDPCNGTYSLTGTYILRFTGVLPGYTYQHAACTPQYGGRVKCTWTHPETLVIN